jgi:magnesium chelatase family protein
MKVFSFISEKNHLIPVEVELTMWPGLPGIQFLGLPDQHLKESALRIKSAIKAQGFEYPRARQILVNLRPSHLKKTSRGIELAVATALLWETEQLAKPVLDQQFFIYGELSLTGEVFEPGDLMDQPLMPNMVVLTGHGEGRAKGFRRMVVKALSDLLSPKEIAPAVIEHPLLRPSLPDGFRLSEEQALVLQVAAVGGHSLLLAGPAGSGKSTLAKSLHQLLPLPERQEWNDVVEIQKRFGLQSPWRPLVKPHHSTPKISMIGGGSIPLAGEISRAHGGVLLLDEFLEFSNSVQEALREPFEEKSIRVARAGRVEEFPAGGLIVGTTNLCPCGEKIPGERERTTCRFTRLRCNSYSQRLSGPILDRFQLLIFLRALERPSVPWQQVQTKIDEATQFRRQRLGRLGQNIGRMLTPSQEAAMVEEGLESVAKVLLEGRGGSERRRIATLCVARTLADLDAQTEVSLSHLDRAMEWTERNFEKMRRWDLCLSPPNFDIQARARYNKELKT